ncbi:MAG: alpha-ketoglutarate-dependent dioxygenase AlkB [Pseudobacteriovorax sp.]|nr:alpha-ketoglutarate-dependent dioxygenase AlkB [Pseudobacteriovorax sp.]
MGKIIESKDIDYIRLIKNWDSASDFQRLDQSITWQQHSGMMFGRELTYPRKSSFIGDPSVSYRYSGRTYHAAPWPPMLRQINLHLEEQCGVRFNGCLANRYSDGSDYMGWHTDNEKEIDQSSPIVILSYGAVRRFGFRPIKDRNNQNAEFYMLDHGDLLVMEANCQSNYKHMLPKMASCKEPRISLTFRRFKLYNK